MYFAALAWLVWTAGTNPHHPIIRVVTAVPYADKFGHFVLMGMLTLVFNYLLRGRALALFGRRTLCLGTLIAASLVVVEEFSQLMIASRTFSLADLAADALGIAAFDWLARNSIGVILPSTGCKTA
jgi:VanZ family protein